VVITQNFKKSCLNDTKNLLEYLQSLNLSVAAKTKEADSYKLFKEEPLSSQND